MNATDFLSACIVTYNDGDKAACAAKSLLAHTQKYPLRLYVVDNASTDGTPEKMAAIPGVVLLQNRKNIGFGAAHNRVLTENLGKYHFIVNPDITVDADVLSGMADYFETRPDVVLACPRVLNADGSEQFLPKERPTAARMFLGRLAPLGGIFRKIRREYVWADRVVDVPCPVDFCTGCFMAVRTAVFERLNGFDERFFMYLEDADLTLRAKAFGQTVIIPQFRVTHLWQRESARKWKYLRIHLSSSLIFLRKQRKRV